MAANYITIGSRFKPFSYDELMAPLIAAEQEHQRQEELYNTYSDTLGQIGGQLSREYDQEILDNIYNPYRSALESAAEELASKGLSSGSRRTLNALRRQFNNELVPVQQGILARAEARKKYDERVAKDPTLITNSNPYYQGVEAYMHGMSPEGIYVSGNELYGRGQALSQAFSEVMRSVPEDAQLALEGQYWQIVSQYGPTSDEARQFMEGVLESIPALSNHIEEIMDNSGIYSEGFTVSDQDRARRYIVEGMMAGLSGDTKVQYLNNQAYGLTGETPEVPEAPEAPVQTPSNMNVYPSAPQPTVKNKEHRQAVSDYEAYSGFYTGDQNSDNAYVLAEVDGEEMLVSPELMAMLVYEEQPEVYDEMRREYGEQLWQEHREKFKHEFGMYPEEQSSYVEVKNDEGIHAAVLQQVNARYPRYSERQLRKTKERDRERFNALVEKYSYISDDPVMNVSLGSVIQLSQSQDTPIRFDFNRETSAGFTINDKNWQNRIVSGRVFKYNPETQTVEEQISAETKKKLLDAKNRYYSIDKKGRVLVSDGENFYYLRGSAADVLKQRGVQARMDALMDFSESGYNVDGISVPGIGTSTDRPVLRVSLSPENWVGYNVFDGNFTVDGVSLGNLFAESPGNFSPIIAGGNTIGYVLAVSDAEGVPHKILITETGVCIGVSNPYSFMGSDATALLEDMIDISYNTEKE